MTSPLVNTEDAAAEMLLRDLEDRRFAAMLRADADSFALLCHPELTYAHSDGSRDTLESYASKLRNGYYTYEAIDHPIERIIVSGDTAVVVGEMNAEIRASGAKKTLANISVSVWNRVGEEWKLISFAPTPRYGKAHT